MRIPCLKMFGYTAIGAPLLFAVCWILSASTDGSWQFGVNSLSDMGISDNAVSAFLFNFGCIITGILGIIIGFGMLTYGKRTLWIGAIPYMVGMMFLSLVGVFTLDNPNVHDRVASAFGLFTGIALIIASASDWRLSWYLYADVILLVLSVFEIMTQPFPMWEAVTTIVTMVWVFILGLKVMRNEEALFSDSPRIGGH